MARGAGGRLVAVPAGMDQNEQATYEFIQRLVAVAPDLTDEQIANIRRLSLGEVPISRKEGPQAIDLG